MMTRSIQRKRPGEAVERLENAVNNLSATIEELKAALADFKKSGRWSDD